MALFGPIHLVDWKELGFVPIQPDRPHSLSKSINGVRFDIELAFSRTPDCSRVYVTDRIRERGADVSAMIYTGGHVFVAGSANKMPSDVRKSIIQVLVEHPPSPFPSPSPVVVDKEERDIGKLEAEAEAILAGMTRTKAYYVEAWS